MGTTIILGVITSFMLFLLTHFYLPLPGMDQIYLMFQIFINLDFNINFNWFNIFKLFWN